MEKQVGYRAWFFEESPVAVVEFTFQFVSQGKEMNIRHAQHSIIPSLLRKLSH